MAVDGPERGDITRLLREWKNGQPDALQQLIPLVYPDLKRIAYGYLQHEKPGHTLQATGLVHELYLRLCNQREANWDDRAHFFTFTAKIMRMILTDHARRNLRLKRGGRSERVPLNDQLASDQLPWINLTGPEYIDLDCALDELEKIDKRKAQMVELCHLLGCTTQESAEMLQISLATAERDLKFARGWLYNRLRPRPIQEGRRSMADVTKTRDGYWRQVEEIFHQALDMPADARAVFVHERCGGDAAMEREVLGMLAGYEAQDRIGALRHGPVDGRRALRRFRNRAQNRRRRHGRRLSGAPAREISNSAPPSN